MIPRNINQNDVDDFKKFLKVPGCEIPWYDLGVTSSTMDVARQLQTKGNTDWSVITAHQQHSGRGTHGRTWSSLAGKGLWMSVIMPPPQHAVILSGLSVLAAEALVKTLEMFADCPFFIKHPNDVKVNNRKIAGILVETATNGDHVQSVILGVGVNFLQTAEDLLKDNLPEATSLLIETGTAPDRDSFITSFLIHLKGIYDPVICIETDEKQSFSIQS